MRRSYRFALSIALAGWAPVVFAQDAKTGSGAHEIVPFADERAAISLSETERAFVKREMRGFLAAMQAILEGAASGERGRIATSARDVGMNGPEKDHIPKSLAPKLPVEFRKLGLATHRAFDEIAAASEKGEGATRSPAGWAH